MRKLLIFVLNSMILGVLKARTANQVGEWMEARRIRAWELNQKSRSQNLETLEITPGAVNRRLGGPEYRENVELCANRRTVNLVIP